MEGGGKRERERERERKERKKAPAEQKKHMSESVSLNLRSCVPSISSQRLMYDDQLHRPLLRILYTREGTPSPLDLTLSWIRDL